jgi:hypothetical protein
MDNDLNERVRRIYAALQHVIGPPVREVPVSTGRFGGIGFMAVDFREGLTDEELSNRVHTVIHNIANLEGHLIRWTSARGMEPDMVRNAVAQSDDLRIVIDLANNDKHGYPPRNGGRSGRSPRLVDLERWLSMTTQAEAGSSVGFTPSPDGKGRIIGDGSAAVVITGAVVDAEGSRVGDLDAILQASIGVWEAFLAAHAG